MIETLQTMEISIVITYIGAAIGLYIFQYIFLVYLDFKVRSFGMLLCAYFFLHGSGLIYFKYVGQEPNFFEFMTFLFKIMLLNIPVLLITVITRELVFVLRRLRFKHFLGKCYNTIDAKHFRGLIKVLPLHYRRANLEKGTSAKLWHVYKTVKNESKIALDLRIAFSKELIDIGLDHIEIPRTYHINIDALSSSSDILNVAKGALNEAKKIVKIAPNASVLSCRKYIENLSKYLLFHHKVEVNQAEGVDGVSAYLYLLGHHTIIEDKGLLQRFYHIKECGNDAAHEQLCDEKTAYDIIEEALEIEQWFRKSYEVKGRN